MARRLIVHPQSDLDIAAAAVWYEDQRSGLGARFVDELSLFQRIQQNPLEFPRLDDDVRRALLRRFPFGVYFLADPSEVKVLAVLHLHRHPDMWKNRN